MSMTKQAATDTERVFVYGTLITGERNAHWADGAKRTKASVKGRLYDTGWSFPAILTGGKVTGKYSVKGEIIETDAEGLARMDVLEGLATGLYKRVRVTAETLLGERFRCWVYELVRGIPAQADEIHSGDWCAWREWREDARKRAYAASL